MLKQSCLEGIICLSQVSAQISSDICSAQLRKYDFPSGSESQVWVWVGSGSANNKDEPLANQYLAHFLYILANICHNLVILD